MTYVYRDIGGTVAWIAVLLQLLSTLRVKVVNSPENYRCQCLHYLWRFNQEISILTST